jgi:hypothetical protein
MTKRACSMRRYGCRGTLVVDARQRRTPDGLMTALVLICNKCDQAHGLYHGGDDPFTDAARAFHRAREARSPIVNGVPLCGHPEHRS